MKNNDVEEKLRRAFSNAAPDVLPSVLERCDGVSVEQSIPPRSASSRRNSAALRRAAAGLAAAFVITAGLLFFNGVGRRDTLTGPNALIFTDACTYAVQEMTALSPDGAVRAAAEYLKLDFNDVDGSSAELMPSGNGFVYFVKISSGKVSYSLYVDAATGEITEPGEFTK